MLKHLLVIAVITSIFGNFYRVRPDILLPSYSVPSVEQYVAVYWHLNYSELALEEQVRLQEYYASYLRHAQEYVNKRVDEFYTEVPFYIRVFTWSRIALDTRLEQIGYLYPNSTYYNALFRGILSILLINLVIAATMHCFSHLERQKGLWGVIQSVINHSLLFFLGYGFLPLSAWATLGWMFAAIQGYLAARSLKSQEILL